MAKVKGRKVDPERSVPLPLHFVAGWLSGAIVLAVMLALSALPISAMGLPSGAAEILMLLSAAVGALVSGFTTARRCGQKYLLCGLAAGAVLFLTVLAAAVLIQSRMPALSDLGRATVFLTAAMIGGVLGVRKGNRQRR